MNQFSGQVLNEPALKFAGGEAVDPRVGLMDYGPRTPSGESEHQVIKIGLIGSGRSIGGVEKLFEDMQLAITADEDSEKRWKPPFPGLGESSPLNISFNTQKRWRQLITRQELEDISIFRSMSQRFEQAVDLIESNMQVLYNSETPPDVFVIAIPDEMMEACTPPHQEYAKMQSKDSDFHNRVKLLGMKIGRPTQLILPKTRKGQNVQDKSEIAWNLAVGMLYKAQQGHPWKLAELEDGTCFAGISFYRERGGDQTRTRTAMAQIFLETGENYIIRGDPLEQEKIGPGNNHLATEDAKKLVRKVLKHYEDHKGMRPRRLVLHKKSAFWPEEREGFKKGASSIPVKDFVTIRERHEVRALSSGKYPVLRGTMVSAPNDSEHYLYTKGYIPPIAAFRGPYVPEPIVIIPDEEQCETGPKKLCEEIMAFTKLDWNTSHFSTKLPVTIGISESVGSLLAEASAREMDVDIHYYYYM